MDAQQRHQYLQAMGIPLWMPKAVCDGGATATVNSSLAESPVPASSVTEIKPTAQKSSDAKAFGELLKGLVNDEQGGRRPAPAAKTVEPLALPPDADCSGLDWQQLQAAVSVCQRCALAKTRMNTVFGVGDVAADWLIVGEAPGAEEDRQGEPFVGGGGQLLNNMLAAIGLPRQAVYILNMVKCRPPGNRDPLPEEARQCGAYLQRQLQLLKPKLILVVGRVAAQNLLQTTLPLARLRGKVHELPGSALPVIVTYHPAYLLRKPIDKRKAWQDLLLAQQVATRYADGGSVS